MHRPEFHARPALVLEIDRRGVGLARDLDARRTHRLHPQEAVTQQRTLQVRLALLVHAVIERVAFVRLEASDGAEYRTELRRVPRHRDLFRNDLHPLAGCDSKECSEPLVVVLQGACNLRVVITVGLEGSADFAFRVIEQAAHLGRRDIAIGVVAQGQLAFHGLLHLLGQPFDVDAQACRRGGPGQPRQPHRNQPACDARAGARTWRSSRDHWTLMATIRGSSGFFRLTRG